MTTVTVVEEVIHVDVSDGASVASVQKVADDLAEHEGDTENPHSVTAAQAGADASGSAAAVAGDLSTHEGDATNPHSVTAMQAGAEPGLGNPATDGFVLSSTIAGIRTWIEMAAAGGGGDVEEALEDGTPYSRQDAGWVSALRTSIANTWGAIQTFSAGIATGIIKPSADAADAIEIQDAGGTPVVTVDTTNHRLNVAGRVETTNNEGFYTRLSNGVSVQVLAITTNDSQVIGGRYAAAMTIYHGISTFSTRNSANSYTFRVENDGRLTLYNGAIRPNADSESAINFTTAGGASVLEIDTLNSLVKLIGAPTADPGVVGALWNNGGVVNISAGP